MVKSLVNPADPHIDEILKANHDFLLVLLFVVDSRTEVQEMR